MESNDITALLLIKDWLNSKPELGEWELHEKAKYLAGPMATLNKRWWQWPKRRIQLGILDEDAYLESNLSPLGVSTPLPPLASPTFFDVLEQLIKGAKDGK